MSLFARILPALVTLAAAAAVVVGSALPASSGTVRLASGVTLDRCHHWHDSDDNDDNDHYDHSRYDHNDNGDRGLLVLHDIL
jgi:hypothetical protein